MNMIDINAINNYLNAGVNDIGDLAIGYKGMLSALDAYVTLRVGLGGSSDSFTAEVDRISKKAKKSCEELTEISKRFKVINPRKKTVREKLKPYVEEFQEIAADIVSLVRKGW